MLGNYWSFDEYTGYYTSLRDYDIGYFNNTGDGFGDGFGDEDGDGSGCLERERPGGFAFLAWQWITGEVQELRWR
jgi:hypothetical protein